MKIEKKFSNSNLLKCVRKCYLDEETADVHFICKNKIGEEERIPAHTLMLKMSSMVMKSMFSGNWLEESEIRIEDASAEGFTEFLQFFYFDEINLTGENISEVNYLVEKYDVDVKEVLETFLIESLDVNTVVWYYQLALDFEIENLLYKCENMIMNSTEYVLKSDGFSHCTKKILQKILSFNVVNCEEKTLFNALMKWISQYFEEKTTEEIKMKKEDLFEELLILIRFPTMDSTDFIKCTESGEVLNGDECFDILKFIINRIPLTKSNRFSTKKRLNLANQTSKCLADVRSRILVPMGKNPVAIAEFCFEKNKVITGITVNRIKNVCSIKVRKIHNSTNVVIQKICNVRVSAIRQDVLSQTSLCSISSSVNQTTEFKIEPFLAERGCEFQIEVDFKDYDSNLNARSSLSNLSFCDVKQNKQLVDILYFDAE